MSELPTGWALTTIGEAAERVVVGFVGPSKQHYNPEGVPFLMGKNIRAEGLRLDDLERTSLAFHARERKSQLRPGDVVVVRIGKSGTAAVIPSSMSEANCGGLVIIKKPLAASSEYLARFLNSPDGQRASKEEARGMTRQTLNTRSVEAAALPLAPVNEQRRIVEKLDAVFDKSRAAKARLERLPALLEKLKRSILAAAFRGDLTKDWRAAHPDVEPASVLLERIRAERRRRWEDGLRAKGKDPKKATYEEPAPVDVAGLPELPEGWAWTTMRELAAAGRYALAIGPFGSSLKVEDYRERGVPLIFVRHVRAKNYSDLKPAFITDEKARDLAAHRVVEADVLVTKMGDPPGDADVYPSGMPPAVITADVIKLTVEPRMAHPNFVATALYAESVREQVLEAAQGVAQQKMSLERFEKIRVPLPPRAEQDALLAVASDVEAALGALSARVRSCASRAIRLEQAALAKAFRGDLVPQDPNDEPASVLLDRIRAARAAEPQRARRGRVARAPEPPAAKPAAATPTNSHSAELAEGAPVDLVVAAFQQAQRLTATAIVDTTGLDTASVKKALKALLDGGHVRVEGKARGTAYVWRGP